MAETEADWRNFSVNLGKSRVRFSKWALRSRRREFLTEFAKDHDCVWSLCITEPNAGSDNAAPYNPPPGQGIATTAVPDGDDYILRGSKNLISLAGFSKLMLVVARTAPKLPARQGSTIFIVPSNLPGISFGQVHNKMGWRLYRTERFFLTMFGSLKKVFWVN